MLTTYQVQCESCSTVFNVTFLIVGTFVVSEPPTLCTKCSGASLRNLSMNFRDRKNLLT